MNIVYSQNILAFILFFFQIIFRVSPGLPDFSLISDAINGTLEVGGIFHALMVEVYVST